MSILPDCIIIWQLQSFIYGTVFMELSKEEDVSLLQEEQTLLYYQTEFVSFAQELPLLKELFTSELVILKQRVLL